MKQAGERLLESIARARTKLIVKHPFFGTICLRLRPFAATEADGVDTAGVAPDYTVVINEDFWFKTHDEDKPALLGLLAHESTHVGLNHFSMTRRFSLRIANLAGDYAMNPSIKACGLRLPEGSLDEYRYHDMSAEQIAVILEREEKENDERSRSRGRDPGQKPDKGGCRGMRPDLASTEKGKAAARGDRAAQQDLEMDAKETIAEAAETARQQGKLPGAIESMVEKVIHPEVSFREKVLRFLGMHGPRIQRNALRPSRRSIACGVHIPSVKSAAPELALLLDTSGSMTGDDFAQALGVVTKVVDEFRMQVLVIQNDAAVQAVHEGLIDVSEIKGRRGHGGSDFRPAFKLLKERGFNGVVIAVTDGYISVPRREPYGIKATMWVLAGAYSTVPAQWGEQVNFE
jgi:predicted metal-dependent peptidase